MNIKEISIGYPEETRLAGNQQALTVPAPEMGQEDWQNSWNGPQGIVSISKEGKQLLKNQIKVRRKGWAARLTRLKSVWQRSAETKQKESVLKRQTGIMTKRWRHCESSGKKKQGSMRKRPRKPKNAPWKIQNTWVLWKKETVTL